MATDTTTLLADAKCYSCQTPGTLQLLTLGLLKQLVEALDSMADTSVNGVLADAKCYSCLPPGMYPLIMLGLLKQIVDAGGVGTGTGGVLCGVLNPPVADPGVACCIYYNTTTGDWWQWNDGAGTWDEVL